MTAAELKPCPFCGSTRTFSDYANYRQWAFCKDCEARGPRVDHLKSTDEVYLAWNRRPTSSPDGQIGKCEKCGKGYDHPYHVSPGAGYSQHDFIPSQRPDVETEKFEIPLMYRGGLSEQAFLAGMDAQSALNASVERDMTAQEADALARKKWGVDAGADYRAGYKETCFVFGGLENGVPGKWDHEGLGLTFRAAFAAADAAEKKGEK